MKIYQVDAFAAKPFKGNPACVCLMNSEKSEEWMQNVAMEMNLSETAFLTKSKDGFDLRWFTPTTEVDLCGHATLASAHIIWETGILPRDAQAKFYTKSGLLSAVKDGDWIEMNFPKVPQEECEPFDELYMGLGVRPSYVGRSNRDYLIEVESEEIVKGAKPDFEQLRAVDSDGFIITSVSQTTDYDFVSRFFAPRLGVNEDPVTGSAHCVLGPYWAEKLLKQELIGLQASKRTGVVKLKVQRVRINIIGKAVTVFKGDLLEE